MKLNQNDNELLYLVAQNDEDAKNKLYKKYQQILIHLASKAYQLCKDMNGASYEDFYQEACYGFEKAIITFDEYQNILFYTYVTACVKNQLTLYRRTITRKRDIPLNYALSLSEEVENGVCYEDLIISQNLTPYEVCEKNELEEALRDFQNTLPFIDACVFELRYNGFSYQEISLILGITLHKVSHIISKMKKQNFLSFEFH